MALRNASRLALSQQDVSIIALRVHTVTGVYQAHVCPKSITGRRLSRLEDSIREENVNDKIMKQVSIPVGATRLKCRQHCVIISAGVTL